MISRILLAAALFFGTTALPVSAADEEVDLELVLAVDVSWSMDAEEQSLQRQGYIEALKHQDVLGAVQAGLTGKIAVVYVEWAGPGLEKVVVPWTLIDGRDAAHAFADRLAQVPISRYRATSISSALAFAGTLFDGNGFRGLRQVVDISGDGPNNMGSPVTDARDNLVQRGIVINGLPIMLNQAGGFYSIDDLDIYYEQCVIGGPGAFIVPVRSLERIADAIRRKLMLEIVGPEPRVMHASEDRPAAQFDCFIGERLFQRWLQ